MLGGRISRPGKFFPMGNRLFQFPNCQNKNVLNPTTAYTQNFISQLFAEVSNLFEDQYFHAGGDEVSYDCWEEDASITQFMSQNNIVGIIKKYFLVAFLLKIDRICCLASVL
jgi:hypothetical protein